MRHASVPAVINKVDQQYFPGFEYTLNIYTSSLKKMALCSAFHLQIVLECFYQVFCQKHSAFLFLWIIGAYSIYSNLLFFVQTLYELWDLRWGPTHSLSPKCSLKKRRSVSLSSECQTWASWREARKSVASRCALIRFSGWGTST